MNVLQPRDNNKPTLNNLPSKEINLNTRFNNNNEKTTVQEVQKPKIVTMIPKFMSSIPYNPFSMGPSQVNNPMNAFQTQDQNIRDIRQMGKINPKPDAEDNSGYPYRRFSLNPLAFPGDNIEQLNKRHSLTGSTGKQLRMSGQKSENNNFGNKYE